MVHCGLARPSTSQRRSRGYIAVATAVHLIQLLFRRGPNNPGINVKVRRHEAILRNRSDLRASQSNSIFCEKTWNLVHQRNSNDKKTLSL